MDEWGNVRGKLVNVDMTMYEKSLVFLLLSGSITSVCAFGELIFFRTKIGM